VSYAGQVKTVARLDGARKSGGTGYRPCLIHFCSARRTHCLWRGRRRLCVWERYLAQAWRLSLTLHLRYAARFSVYALISCSLSARVIGLHSFSRPSHPSRRLKPRAIVIAVACPRYNSMEWYHVTPPQAGKLLIVLQLDLIPPGCSFYDVAETVCTSLRDPHWAAHQEGMYCASTPVWFELFLQPPVDSAPTAHRNGGSAMLHLCSSSKLSEQAVQVLSTLLGYNVSHMSVVPLPLRRDAFQHLYGSLATARHPEPVTAGRQATLRSRTSTAWMTPSLKPPCHAPAQKRSTPFSVP
jgi:hypothetical protein